MRGFQVYMAILDIWAFASLQSLVEAPDPAR